MADKTTTIFDPTEIDVQKIEIRYTDGTVSSAELTVFLRTNDSSNRTIRRVMGIDVSDLSAGQQSTLNSICTAALNIVRSKLGFS